MITIKHVLQDGTQVDSVEGKVIKADQHKVLYEIIKRLSNDTTGTDAKVLSER